ncbi:MAG: hypothetical protein ONB06_07220 [candidate division KSB1 bacterium]|nr:hypothetical protein [candidate division KSB1 bacterium]
MMFDFDLDESAELGRILLERETGRSLPHWQTVVESYRRAKADLIDRLDPRTGRVVVKIKAIADPEAEDEAINEALRRLHPRKYSCRDIAGWEAVASHPEYCEGSSSNYCCPVGYLRANGAYVDQLSGVRRGMKFTRALAAALRHVGVTEDAAAKAATLVGDALTAVPREDGYIVLSANILDILMASELAAWRSCHGLSGVHRAGPQQYLHDNQTLVAYFYRKRRRHPHLPDHALPYKLWRQMVYVDFNANAAALQREYGQELPPAAHNELWVEIGKLLGAPDVSAVWLSEPEQGDVEVYGGASLAYVDYTRRILWVGDEHGPEAPVNVQLAEHVPCAECGGELSDPRALVCEGRGDSTRNIMCELCGDWVSAHRIDTVLAHYGVELNCCDSCCSTRAGVCRCCGARYVREALSADGCCPTCRLAELEEAVGQ